MSPLAEQSSLAQLLPNTSRIDAARGMTIGDQLARQARTNPTLVAYRFGARQQTFAATLDRVDRLGTALVERGVRPGDRVAILMHNSIEFVEMFWATARIGAIAVPINFRLAAEEIAYILDNCAARLLFVDEAMSETATAAVSGRAGLGLICTMDEPHRLDNRAESYEAVIAAATPIGSSAPTVALDDAAFIIYTSGTTGRPKGAVLSHANLLFNTYTKISTHGITGQDEV
jgi:fatty-acyl-CoA synthase